MQHPLLPRERSHLSVWKYSLQLGIFKPEAVRVRRAASRSPGVSPRREPSASMFGGGTMGDAAGMDAAVITIFVVAVVLVGVIALGELGRRR